MGEGGKPGQPPVKDGGKGTLAPMALQRGRRGNSRPMDPRGKVLLKVDSRNGGHSESTLQYHRGQMGAALSSANNSDISEFKVKVFSRALWAEPQCPLVDVLVKKKYVYHTRVKRKDSRNTNNPSLVRLSVSSRRPHASTHPSTPSSPAGYARHGQMGGRGLGPLPGWEGGGDKMRSLHHELV